MRGYRAARGATFVIAHAWPLIQVALNVDQCAPDCSRKAPALERGVLVTDRDHRRDPRGMLPWFCRRRCIALNGSQGGARGEGPRPRPPRWTGSLLSRPGLAHLTKSEFLRTRHHHARTVSAGEARRRSGSDQADKWPYAQPNSGPAHRSHRGPAVRLFKFGLVCRHDDFVDGHDDLLSSGSHSLDAGDRSLRRPLETRIKTKAAKRTPVSHRDFHPSRISPLATGLARISQPRFRLSCAIRRC